MAISVMYHSVQKSVAFIHTNDTDPARITPFYQKSSFPTTRQVDDREQSSRVIKQCPAS